MTVVLTFDTDWMHPEWMETFLEEFPELPRSTFFIHSTSDGWRPLNHDVGPHPTIHSFESEPEIPSDLYTSGVRAHSCVTSHMLSLHWARQGFIYESNTTRFLDNSIQPTRTPWGIWELPIFYMDNVDLCLPQNWSEHRHQPLNLEVTLNEVSPLALSIFDFHPLHIALNSQSFDDYQVKKEKIQNGYNPWKLSSGGHGVRVFFESLLDNFMNDSYEIRTAESLVKDVATGTKV